MRGMYLMRNLNIGISVIALGMAVYGGYEAYSRNGARKPLVDEHGSTDRPVGLVVAAPVVQFSVSNDSRRAFPAERPSVVMAKPAQVASVETTGSVRTQPLRLGEEVGRAVNVEQNALEIGDWARSERDKIYRKNKLRLAISELEASFRDEIEIYRVVISERQREADRLHGRGPKICQEDLGRSNLGIDTRFARVSTLKEERARIYGKFHAEKQSGAIEQLFSMESSIWRAIYLDQNMEVLRFASLVGMLCKAGGESAAGVASVSASRDSDFKMKDFIVQIFIPIIVALVGLFSAFVSHLAIKRFENRGGGSLRSADFDRALSL